MEWQPIDTAPKDGSMVLVNDTTPGWTPWAAAYWIDGDEWSGWVYDDENMLDSNPLGPRPTHWLYVPPLPTPNAALTCAEGVRVEGTVMQRKD